MRSYNVIVASLAIDAPVRWTDNILSQFRLPDVVSTQRGVARRIQYPGLVRLAVIRQLHDRLGIGVADAVGITSRLLDPAAGGIWQEGQLRLSIDRAMLERALDTRLGDLLESVPTPRRGRPPRRRTA